MAKSDGKNQMQQEANQQRPARPAATTGGGLSRSGGHPLSRFRTEFDRLFDEFFRGWGGLATATEEPLSAWSMDVDDQDDKIVVRAEAPGFEPGDFDLQVRDNQLLLCACESEESKQDGGRQWRQREFYRSIPLSSEIDAEKVDAQYRNGILTVTLPKTEKTKSRRIEVKA